MAFQPLLPVVEGQDLNVFKFLELPRCSDNNFSSVWRVSVLVGSVGICINTR